MIRHVVARCSPLRVVAWSVLVSLTLALVFVVQALAMRATTETPPSQPSRPYEDICLSPFPLTAALGDGDEVRARFLASFCRNHPHT